MLENAGYLFEEPRSDKYVCSRDEWRSSGHGKRLESGLLYANVKYTIFREKPVSGPGNDITFKGS